MATTSYKEIETSLYDGILVKKSLAYRSTTSNQKAIVLEVMKANDKMTSTNKS